MLRRLKSDVFDLPDKLYIDELVEMGDKQKRIYDEVTMDIKMHIDEIKMSNNPLAELIRMRQALQAFSPQRLESPRNSTEWKNSWRRR